MAYKFNPFTGKLEEYGPILTGTGTVAAAADGTAALPGISFANDLSVGIYRPGAEQLAFSTNGTGRLFVDASGNVGVGSAPTVTAGRSIDVNGGLLQPLLTLRATSATSATTAYTLNTTNSSVDLISSDWPVRCFVNGTERLRITSAGLVGIGTSAPLSTFHVKGADPQLFLEDTGGGPGGKLRAIATDNGAMTFLRYLDNGTLAGEHVRIDASGRVGIGTTSPGRNLHVVAPSGSGNATFAVERTDATTAALVIGAESNIIKISARETSASSAVGRDIQFESGPLSTVRIDSSGRLLVGTSSDIGGGERIQANGQLALYDATSSIAGAGSSVNFRTDGGAVGAIKASISGQNDSTYSYAGRLVFSTTADGASSPTERMRIDSNGRVIYGSALSGSSATASSILTIGTATATGTVGWESYVTSTSTRYHASFSISGTVVGSISTNGSATAFNTSSDYRLKENITPVTDGITRLQQLKPSRFNFIADPSTVVDGFIAHEVQTIVPEAITGEKDAVDDEGNLVYQGIDQSKLVPLLTAALQEAVAKIESLEARLTAAGI